jgi:molybdate transport system substrate-binding protein
MIINNFAKIKKLLNFLIFCIFFTSISTKSFGSQSRNLTVFSEPNMAMALSKIARQFSQKNNVIVSINFSSSFDLINEIDLGAPANVFISAHPQIIENLRQKGVVDVYNVAYIANDELVLSTSKTNNHFPIKLLKKNINLEDSLKILDENKLSLIIDHEGVSSGIYSKKIIQNLSLGNLKIFNKLPEDQSSLIRDIENNKDTYGLLFRSQLQNNNNLRILATQKDKNIFYQAFVIAGDRMDVAREFLNFLKTPNSKDILRNSGFIVE